VKSETISFGSGFSGYVAYEERAKLPLPSVIVIQEAWGVSDHIEDVTRRIAAAGYVAFAPDLYARNGARLAGFEKKRVVATLAVINANPSVVADKTQRSAAFAGKPELAATLDKIFAELQNPEYIGILEAAAKFLASDFAPSRGQKIGSVGFCMGGHLSALLAARAPLSAAAILYGNPIADPDIAKVSCPVLGLYGANDKRVSDQVPAFAQAMQAQGKKFEHVIYEGAGHAFFNDTRPAYDVNAARDAFVRILALFRTQLAAA
jgi:carboxymethylenebutenolidase